MRVANSIIGGITTFFLLVGVLFKIMHWPGAGVMIVLFSSLLSMYVFLVAGANISKYKGRSFLQACNGIGGFGASILSIGLLFKIMHWPGSGAMMFLGLLLSGLVVILFMVFYIVKKEPIHLSSGTFFVIICFGILLYGVSVGGSSKSLLVNVTENAEKIEKNTTLIIKKNSEIIDFFNNKADAISRESKQIYEVTLILNIYIDNLKSLLYENTDAIPKEIADTISITLISSKDNYDIPSLTLGLADPSNPRNGEYTAKELKEKINHFNNIVKVTSPNIKTINTEDYSYYNGKLDSWETSMFYHYTLSQVILTLNQIQLEANIICNTILTDNLLKVSSTQEKDTIN